MIYQVDETGREQYTQTTTELVKEVRAVLAPIFAKYYEMGYKRHEIEYLMTSEVALTSITHKYLSNPQGVKNE